MEDPYSIWLEHPNQQMTNVGDLAMLMMDVERARSLFPNVVLRVPSGAQDWMDRFCPAATRVTASGLYHLAWRGLLPRRLTRFRPFQSLEYRWLTLNAHRYLRVVDWRNGIRGQRDPHSRQELNLLARSQAVIACGGGYLSDAFTGAANRCTKVLLAAQSRGIPTALMGQGLGPITQEDSSRLIGSMLSRARFIGLREGVAGPSLARSLGAPAERIQVTGDSALDLAARERQEELGVFVGFNVRVAPYAKTDLDSLTQVAQTVAAFSNGRGAAILPCPIHFGKRAPDESTARTLLSARASVHAEPCPFDPVEVIRRVGRCRIVVTGSYHAAVFALAQGIPVIGLVASRYYGSKFLGLAGLFGRAIEVVDLGQSDYPQALSAALEHAWMATQSIRGPCRLAADQQRRETRHAWSRLPAQLFRSPELLAAVGSTHEALSF